MQGHRLYLTLSGECVSPLIPTRWQAPQQTLSLLLFPLHRAQGQHPTVVRKGTRGLKGFPPSVCGGFLKDAALPRAAGQRCLSSDSPCSRFSALPLPGHEVSVCISISILSFRISKMHTACLPGSLGKTPHTRITVSSYHAITNS